MDSLIQNLPLDTVAEDTSDPVLWITQNFYIPETKAPLTLAIYQQACLREAFSKDADGLYHYSTIVWSDIKKSAKTTIAAAVAAYIASTKQYARIRFVGNDQKQADSRVFSALTTAIDLHPKWRETVRVKNHFALFPNNSSIESVPVDPGGEAGGNDDMIEWTELWDANTDAHKKMWTEMTLSPTKFGKSFRWIDTYAGYQGESETLENLYNQIVKDEYKIDLSFTDENGVYHDLSDLEVYANRESRIFCLWNTKPRLEWQTDAYYRQEATSLLFNEFRRIHRNQWISSVSAFITEAEWDACYQEHLRIMPREAIYLALDAGISDDNFALTGSTVRGNKVQAQIVRLWEPPPNGKIDFGEVDEALRELRKHFLIVEIAYDPYQLHDMATRLAKEFGDIWFEFSQGAERMQADRQLYNLIREKRLAHNGNPQLRQHILNANAKTTGDYDKLRLIKRSDKLKIDLAVSLSMSAWRALLNGSIPMNANATGARANIAQQHERLPNELGVKLRQGAGVSVNVMKPSTQYVVVARKPKSPM